MIMSTDKRYIWIIGASAGIGRALAKALAEDGHHIAISARNTENLNKLHDELKGDKHLVSPLDVGNLESVQQAHLDILEHWPKIDSVIFMAGLYQPMKMSELDIAQAKKILDVNLMGAFHVAHVLLPYLRQNTKNQLVFCASVAGYRGLPNAQPYGASKAGLINMVETLKAEHGTELDIKLINPGFVESRLTDKNDFHMPAKITAEKAAQAIIKGLNSKAFEIHFPKRFTYMMKLIKLMPYRFYYKIMK